MNTNMNTKKLLTAVTLLTCIVAATMECEAQRHRLRDRARGFWPFSQSEQQDVVPPDHDFNANTGIEQGESISPPETLPEPDESVPIVPVDSAECNVYVSKQLGGYTRANYTTKSGVKVDVYQARGKQRVVWAVEGTVDWQRAVIRALVTKSTTGAGQAGVALIGNALDSDVMAAASGGGLWLVLVDNKTGESIKLIYPTRSAPIVEPSDKLQPESQVVVQPDIVEPSSGPSATEQTIESPVESPCCRRGASRPYDAE